MTTSETAKTGNDKGSHARVEIPLRPGVTFPNWSAVTSEAVREALEGLLELDFWRKDVSGYGAEEDGLRQAVLYLYRALGQAPSVAELAEATGHSDEEVHDLLRRLKSRDMVVLDAASSELTGAYPFTERNTGHRIRMDERVLNAMCAVDALGVGAMYGTDISIESSCRHCGAEIRITTRASGKALDSASPPETVVWFGVHYQDQAATSLCKVLTFFCSDAHLEAWRKDDPAIRGYRLSLDEGMEAGKALFTPLLAEGSSTA